jgi:Domain of unknown function (DUF4158)
MRHRGALGYRDFAAAEQELAGWVAARAWNTGDGPKALFDAAVGWLVDQRVLLPGVPRRRLAALARHGMVSKAPVLGRLATDRKAATLLATVRHLLAVAIDDALDLFDVLMSTRLLARAERATAAEHIRSLPRLARASATLARVVEGMLAVAETGRRCRSRSCGTGWRSPEPRSWPRRRRCGS